ncbi:putative HNHc nuclease [Leuconostoc citreum]|uniref:putative HNHc nuclease n=1 Tax=Leuconostoc citreum TaxID=33964 RepID=UPI0032E024C9
MQGFQAYPIINSKNNNEVTLRFENELAVNRFLSTYQLFKQILVEIQVRDGREISVKQRNYIYALFKDISDWSGYAPDIIKQEFKFKFECWRELDTFSLSNVEKSVAATFISYLLNFVVEHNVPLSFKPLDALEPEDVAHFEYACLMNKCCVICGKKPSELHHIDTVAANGGYRAKINHLGLRVAKLCTMHHEEAGRLPPEIFLSKYHINGMKIDEHIAKVHRLNIKEK